MGGKRSGERTREKSEERQERSKWEKMLAYPAHTLATQLSMSVYSKAQ
jgi:hypothetical protein